MQAILQRRHTSQSRPQQRQSCPTRTPRRRCGERHHPHAVPLRVRLSGCRGANCVHGFTTQAPIPALEPTLLFAVNLPGRTSRHPRSGEAAGQPSANRAPPRADLGGPDGAMRTSLAVLGLLLALLCSCDAQTPRPSYLVLKL